jgi:hypothetical protein
VSREEFWHGMGEDEMAVAFAFVPKDQRQLIFNTDRKAFEVF